MSRIEQGWYEGGVLSLLLRPVSWFFHALVIMRCWFYRRGLFKVNHFPVPLIVVGNISVGGTGKTPFVIWLVDFLRRTGYKPGLVSRGYRGHAAEWPQRVKVDSDPYQVGDEAVLLARRCRCPMVVGPDRAAAVNRLLQDDDCDIVISDDGLQHYAMARDIEIVIIDGQRRFGNQQLLPAGPLREPVARLNDVDLVVINGEQAGDDEHKMTVLRSYLYNLLDPSTHKECSLFKGKTVHAVAGIGHPQKFFALLNKLDIEVIEHAFEDHHRYCDKELDFGDDKPVVMTEKDAVKYSRFVDADTTSGFWAMAIEMEPEAKVEEHLHQLLNSVDATINKRTQ